MPISRTEINPHEPGAKLDQGKPDVDLVLGDFAHALWEVAKVGTFGANKYSRHGWLEVKNGFQRYSSAMQRHYLEECKGHATDEESGLAIAAHTAWNALARLELLLRFLEEGDNGSSSEGTKVS